MSTLEIGTVFTKCIPFLQSIGIEIKFRKIDGVCFLPGLIIEGGNIIIDREALLHPGDILHEAGHIAVVPASERALMSNGTILESKNRETEEMMAIAWSYAACIHLDIDPSIVFHEGGYKGGGESIVENFNAGDFFGISTLEWCNMTTVAAYPKMSKWLRN